VLPTVDYELRADMLVAAAMASEPRPHVKLRVRGSCPGFESTATPVHCPVNSGVTSCGPTIIRADESVCVDPHRRHDGHHDPSLRHNFAIE
jgi:hypothetical protein